MDELRGRWYRLCTIVFSYLKIHDGITELLENKHLLMYS